MLSCHQATTTSFGRCLIGSGLLAMPATGAGLSLSASKAAAGRAGACLTGLKKPAGAHADHGHELQLEVEQEARYIGLYMLWLVTQLPVQQGG